MRKNASDDFDNLPSLHAGARDDDEFEPRSPSSSRDRDAVYSRSSPVVRVKAPSTGALWAMIGALFIALGGLGWWSFQQIGLLEQQLVATQESFARTSEEATGRLQAISGTVASTQTNATTGSEALRLQLQQLQDKLDEQNRQQGTMAGQQGSLQARLDQAQAQASARSSLDEQVQAQLKALAGEMATLKAGQADQGKIEARLDSLVTDMAALRRSQTDTAKVDARLESLSAEIAGLKKQGNGEARLDRLEQDVLVLKSEQDKGGAAASGPSITEFDAFRGQTTRNLTTLQSQMQNLQQQINQR